MENSSYKQRIFEFIKQADEIELICLVAIIMTDQADRLSGYECPKLQATKGTFKRAVKRLRVAQVVCPEASSVYEGAIQFIRQEWLHKEAV